MATDSSRHGFERLVVGGDVVEVVDASFDGGLHGALDLCRFGHAQAACPEADYADVVAVMRQNMYMSGAEGPISGRRWRSCTCFLSRAGAAQVFMHMLLKRLD